MAWSSGKYRLPAVFGRYVLLHRISRGGMGEIFLAKLGELQGFEKPIIIKKLLPDLAQDREFLQKFVTEAQITIKLSHGNIAQVYEVGMVDGEYFLAMEYVNGRDLRSLGNRCDKKSYTLAPDICLFLVREVANALAYAHRRKDESGASLDLVHCDISPPNVLVSYEGEVKVIDFGIARSAMLRGMENEEVGFGKFGYMAPEQLIRGAALDRRTDIYSTGVVLHELLTGQRLFNFPPGTSYREVARVVTASRVSPPSRQNKELDDGIDRLVMRALRVAPEERYQSAEELRDAVQQELYVRNPTISADDLADVMGNLFAEEMEASRQVISLLSETRIDTFEEELTDATTNTVSYALSDLWSGPDTPLSLPPPARPGPDPTVNLGPLRGAKTGEQPLLPAEPGSGERAALTVEPAVRAGAAEPRNPQGTRKLSQSEQAQAVRTGSLRVSTSPEVTAEQPSPLTRRASWPWSVALLAVLLGGGVFLGKNLLAPRGPRPWGDPPLNGSVQGGAAQPADASVPLPDLPSPDTAQAISFDPEPVHLTPPPDMGADQAAPAPDAARPDAAPKKTIRRRPKTRRRAKISQASVQRKYRQLRREYERFTRSYGRRLEQDWQKILFAYTYGDRKRQSYRKLNAMLDQFRKKMRKLKQ